MLLKRRAPPSALVRFTMCAPEIAICEKANLTLAEASAYFNIGINKLREISNAKDCPFVLWVGNKRLIKRKLLESYLEKEFSI